MSEVNVFTDIGVLEWDMSILSSTVLDIESRLQFIRPTTLDDLINSHLLIVREYDLQNDDDAKAGVLRAIHAALLQLEQYQKISDKILLHLRMEQLNQNFKIRCTAYRENKRSEFRRLSNRS